MEIINQINEYINPAMLAVVVALWFIGYGLKQTPKVPNWSILWIIVILGIVAGMLLVSPTIEGIIQGILAAALSILGHQAVKQTANGVKETQ